MPVSLQDLPVEILQVVFASAPQSSLPRLVCSCRRFYEAFISRLYENLHVDVCNSDVVTDTFTRVPYLPLLVKSLTLDCNQMEVFSMYFLVSVCRNVSTVTLYKVNHDQFAYNPLLLALVRLDIKSLSMLDADICFDDFRIFLWRLPSLQSFKLYELHDHDGGASRLNRESWPNLPNLVSFSLSVSKHSGYSAPFLSKCSSQATIFSLDGLDMPPDLFFQSATSLAGNAEDVSLINRNRLTWSGEEISLENCQCLQRLRITCIGLIWLCLPASLRDLDVQDIPSPNPEGILDFFTQGFLPNLSSCGISFRPEYRSWVKEFRSARAYSVRNEQGQMRSGQELRRLAIKEMKSRNIRMLPYEEDFWLLSQKFIQDRQRVIQDHNVRRRRWAMI